ncbi:DUF3850 domain-containing protein [Facklamia miroungae]|uniref:DUF3850 domain-containing protein n=1 Tax=Facklamia miroungae TaxID=120956 RepID=A0A1G7RXZ6_9LACT|nr:DUF3850 domain-containing protein [Facklamia miroungae]NKZ29236.1 DUF3850 domain-containing protein [Facklamia miroungae]SDG15564.1 protein of unknown function [Facklamia miroungae]
MIHELKIDEIYFEDILSNNKQFEIRYNDRNFKKDDKVILKEINSFKKFTGREIEVKIIYLTEFEQKEGYVVFGFKKL